MGGATGVMEGLTVQGRLWIFLAVSRDITGGFCLVLKALWLLQCREAHQAGGGGDMGRFGVGFAAVGPVRNADS